MTSITKRLAETSVAEVRMPLIFGQISKVMEDISAIDKDRRNTQQSYNFRGIDDVYNAVHSILAKHKVFTVPMVLSEETEERQSKGGSSLIYRKLKILYRFYAEDGSFIDATVIGEGMDSGDKASNKAMSVAHKYALIQVFCIPTKEDKDPEAESPEVAPKPKPTPNPDVPKEAATKYDPVRGEAYNPKLPHHNEYLEKRLKEMNVERSKWKGIALEMIGKYDDEFDSVMRRWLIIESEI